MAQTPLHVAAGNNRADIVKFLLDFPGSEKVELEAQNMVSHSAINFSLCVLSESSLVYIDYLLNLQYGETPLHMAAKNGCNEAARLLLARGAFIEAKANVLPSFYSFVHFSSL